MASDPTTTNPASSPAGFCPHCGYPMDAGKCPECGVETRQEKLARIAPRLQRKRRIRQIVALGVVTLLALAGYFVITRLDWLEYAPTSILFSLQTDPRDRYSVELHQRLSAGALDGGQAFRLLKSSIWSRLDIRSPHPAGEPIAVESVVMVRVPPGGELNFDKEEIIVDGVQTSYDGGELTGISAPLGLETKMWRRHLSPLQPGTHEIEVSHEFTLRSTSVPIPGLPFTTTVNLSKEIMVEDHPLHHYVNPVWDAAIALQVEDAMRARIGWGGTAYPYFGLDIIISSISVPLAVDAFVRPEGSADYLKSTQPIVLRPGEEYEATNIPFAGADQTHCPDHVHLCLRPNPKAALDAGFQEYFGGTIEWSSLPVISGGSDTTNDPLANTVRPTSVQPPGEE